MNTTCCNAVQDKIWVTDPVENPWEVFYTHRDSEFEAAEERAMPSVCCATAPETTIQKLVIQGANKCC
jgi:hypothetical protein